MSPTGYLYCRSSTKLFRSTSPVSVNNIEKNNTLNIYPNPSNGIFTIETGRQAALISITDITGKTIMSSGHVLVQIDISNQPAGLYVIKLYSENKTLSKKLIISH